MTATLQRRDRTRLPGLDGCAAVLDLSRGAYGARAAASQLAAALGRALPGAETLYDGADPETVARGVDAEARGPLPVLIGARDAQALGPALPKGARIGVIVDPDRPPEDADHWFLACLDRMGLACMRLPLSAAPPVEAGTLGTAQRALLALYPGPLPRPLADAAGLDLADPDIFVPGHPGVIAPGLHGAHGVRVSQLMRFQPADPVLQLLCQMHGPAHYADAADLTERAMALFHAGAEQLALRVLVRACAVARDPGAASGAQLSLQGLRIFTHRYAEAAAHDAPADLPPMVAAQLATLRAWAEMFGPEPQAGLARIGAAMAQAAAADPPDTEDLFVLNIGALGQLRTGDDVAALATEKRIETALARVATIDHRAEFINAINLARLHRRSGDRQACRGQVDRAMATSEGLRSLGDILQMNLIRTWPGVSTGPVAHHVLRAALAWLALSPPEALAIRALRQVDPGIAPGPDMPRRVSEALAARVLAQWPDLAPQPGLTVTVAPAQAPDGSRVLATPAAALLIGAQDCVPLAAPCPARDRLLGLVRAALQRDCPALAGLGPVCLAVDDGLGRDIPQGRAGLLSLVRRHGIAAGLGPEGDLRWSAEDRAGLARAVRVALSGGVAGLEPGDPLRVRFKRYRAPLDVTGPEARLLAALGPHPADPARLARQAGLTGSETRAALARLERARVLTQEISDA